MFEALLAMLQTAIGTAPFLLIIVFILFVFAVKRVLGIVKNAFIIFIASVLFPIVASRVGFGVPADPASIVAFATAGMFLYALYLLASVIYKTLSIAEKVVGGGKRAPARQGAVKESSPRPEPVRAEPATPVLQRLRKPSTAWMKKYLVIDEQSAEPAGRKAATSATHTKRRRGRPKKVLEPIPVIGE